MIGLPELCVAAASAWRYMYVIVGQEHMHERGWLQNISARLLPGARCWLVAVVAAGGRRERAAHPTTLATNRLVHGLCMPV